MLKMRESQGSLVEFNELNPQLQRELLSRMGPPPDKNTKKNRWFRGRQHHAVKTVSQWDAFECLWMCTVHADKCVTAAHITVSHSTEPHNASCGSKRE